MEFRELTIEEFDNFSSRFNPVTPYQTSAYGNTMTNEKYTSYYLGLVENNIVVAASYVMVKQEGSFKYGYSPRGFLIDYQNDELVDTFTKELKKYLSKKDVVALKINPMIVRNIYDSNYNLISSNPDYDKIFSNLKKCGYNHLGYNDYFESFKPRYEAIIDLSKDYISLFQNMTKPFRTKVRSAENNGVRIYKGSYENIELLYDQAKKKYPRELKYYQNLYTNFDKSNSIELYYAKLDVSVYLAKNQQEYLKQETYNNELNNEVLKNRGKSHQKLLNKKMDADKNLNLYHKKLTDSINLTSNYPDGIVLAVVLITKMNNTINIIIDSFDKRFNTFNAKHLIIWKLMEKYSKQGYHYFNLGGITNKVDKNNKYYGLNNYKLGFGSNVYEYIGDLELVTNRTKYIMYRNTAPIFKK